MRTQKITIFFATFIFLSHTMNAQKIFTLDEMLRIGLCKDVKCFDKAAIANGYKRNISFGQSTGAMADYIDTHPQKNGVENRMSWIEANDKHGMYHYAAFLISSDEQADKIAKELDNKQFKIVRNKEIGKPWDDNYELVTFLKKSNTGIKMSIHTIQFNNRPVTMYAFGISTPCPPDWPANE